jgi:hypothetical protein
MDVCCICKENIDLDFRTYYWTECWVCKKLLCHKCIAKDENKISIGLDIISHGWYVADDAFENIFCDKCFNLTTFKKRNKKYFKR